jgi:hypothetical protein
MLENETVHAITHPRGRESIRGTDLIGARLLSLCDVR